MEEHALPTRWGTWVAEAGEHTVTILESIPLELLKPGPDGPDEEGLMALAIGCGFLDRLTEKIKRVVTSGLGDEGLAAAVFATARDHVDMSFELASIERLPETRDPMT